MSLAAGWRLMLSVAVTLAVGEAAGRVPKPHGSGELNGVVRTWYENGVQRDERGYENGLEQGAHIGWWENGKPRLESGYSAGRREGRMLERGPSGQLFHLGTYVHGKEQGRQMMWNPDGSLRANYIVRDNRRYGFMGAVGCTGGDSTRATPDADLR